MVKYGKSRASEGGEVAGEWRSNLLEQVRLSRGQ